MHLCFTPTTPTFVTDEGVGVGIVDKDLKITQSLKLHVVVLEVR